MQRIALTSIEQGAIYGKCIAAKYTDAEKGMCSKEFAEFKKCIQLAVSDSKRRGRVAS